MNVDQHECRTCATTVSVGYGRLQLLSDRANAGSASRTAITVRGSGKILSGASVVYIPPSTSAACYG